MSTTLPSLFLSYARADDEPFVRRLYDDLKARGFDVWFDRVNMPNRGLTFTDEIRRTITERDRLLLVVGPRAVASYYVQQEWSCALDLDKPVHPLVRLGEVNQLPERLALYDARFMQDDTHYDAELTRLIDQLQADPPRLGALHAVPTLPHHFLERPEALHRLREALTADLERKIAVTGTASRVGAQGMGGIGKSVLAACVARDPKVRKAFPDGVYWVPLGETPPLLELQRDLAREMADPADFDSEAAGRQRLRELLQERQALVILDDLWEAKHAEAFDILGPNCRMLVTTRDASLVTTLGGQHFEVQLLSDDDALRLLASWASVEFNQVPEIAKQIVAECGRLPLALAICGAMVRDRRPWADVLADLQEAELEFLRHDLPNYPHKDVWKAIKIGIDALTRERPEYRERFAELAVFPTDETVPEAAVAVLWAHTGGIKDRRARDLLRLMASKSLIRLDSDSTVGSDAPARISLHDLIHDFARRLAGNPQKLHEQWLAAYKARSPDGWSQTPDDGYFYQHLVHHLAETQDWAEAKRVTTDFDWLMRKCELNLLDSIATDYARLHKEAPSEVRTWLTVWHDFFREKAHILRRGLGDGSAHKILLQLAVEHADDSPPTQAAEAWLADGRCNYLRLQRVNRPARLSKSACVSVLEGHTAGVLGALSLVDGRLLSWSGDHTLRVWDCATRACQSVLEGHTHWVLGALQLRDGRLVSWSRDRTLRMWDSTTGMCLTVLGGHKDSIMGALPLADDQLLSWSRDSTLQVWDAATGTCLNVLAGHANSVEGALQLSDGRLLSWSRDRTLRIWDRANGNCPSVLEGHRNSVLGGFPLADDRLISWSRDGTLRIWNSATCACLSVLEGHTDSVDGALLLPDGGLLSWSRDGTLRLWDSETGFCLQALEGHTGEVEGALPLPDGRLLSWSRDETLRIWDSATGACLSILKGHMKGVNGAMPMADDRLLSWSGDGTLRMWNSTTGNCLSVLKGHTLWVRGVLSLSNDWFLSWSDDNTLRVWDNATGVSMSLLEAHTDVVKDALPLSDGRFLSWSWDFTLRIWDSATGSCLRILEGHTRGVKGALTLADGRVLSWSQDRTLRLWDSAAGTCLAVLTEEEAAARHPEWLQARATATQPRNVVSDFFAESRERTTVLRQKVLPTAVATWNAESASKAHCLVSDGTLVVGQANGQVCILKLYHGPRRISLEEAKMLLQDGRTTTT